MRTAIAIFCTLFAAAAAHARPGDASASWGAAYTYGVLTNCNDASINVAATCGGTSGIKVEGYDHLVLEIAYTNSAGTGWEFQLQACDEGNGIADCLDAADWYDVPILTVGSPIAISVSKYERSVSANDSVTLIIDVGFRRIRLEDFAALGTPDAGDKVTVSASVYRAGGY